MRPAKPQRAAFLATLVARALACSVRFRYSPRSGRGQRICCLVACVAVLLSCSSKGNRRVAVLPFENLSDRPELSWLGRGLAEAIRLQLTGSERTRAFFVPSLRDVPATGASQVLQGYFSEVRGRLHVNLVLQDAAGKPIRTAAESASSGGDPVRIADALARQLRENPRPPATRNPEALHAFVEGLEASDRAARDTAFQRAIDLDPQFAAAYLAWAEPYVARGDRAAAASILEKSRAHLAQFPLIERARLAYLSAALAGDRGAQRNALAALAQADPDDPTTHRSLAELHTADHDYAAAARAWAQVTEADPQDVLAWNQLGYVRCWAGDLEGALEALRRYRDLRPDEPNPLDSLGDAYYSFGRFAEAEKSYLDAHAKNAAFLGGGELAKAAWARLMTGDLAGSDELFSRFVAARQEARDPLVPHRQAEWEFLTGRRRQALSRMASFASSAQGPARALGNVELAIWSLDLGERARAGGYVEQVPAGSPMGVMFRFLTEQHGSPGEWQARAEAVFAGPLAPLKSRALGMALLFSGDFAAAAPVLEQTYRLSQPASAEQPNVLLAWALVETSRTRDAAPLLRLHTPPDPVSENPFSSLVFPRVLYLDGVVAQSEGRREDAKRSYRLFLQYCGDLPSAFGEAERARRSLAALGG